MSSRAQTYINEAITAAPSASVAGMHLFGIALSDWVLILSGVLITLQVIFLLRRELFKKDKTDGSNGA